MHTLRLGIAQINPTVGDLSGNTAKIIDCVARARELSVDLLTFPELGITGYPPEDLLLKPKFIRQNRERLDEIVRHCVGLAVVVGFVDSDSDIYNAAAIIYDRKLAGVYHKIYLPNYGVFDENRYFQAGRTSPVFNIYGVGIGVTICEDMWYETGPATVQVKSGARVLLNISASPYYASRGHARERMFGTRASDNVAVVVYNNMVGGQDELVFDGHSLVFNERGEVLARGKQFAEDFLVTDLDLESVFRSQLHDPRRRKELSSIGGDVGKSVWIEVSGDATTSPKLSLPAVAQEDLLDGVAEVYQALVLGTRDYVRKNGFHKVVIGLSGGVDSSLVAVLATDALGWENVVGVSMPSRYTSDAGKSDAEQLARNLGIEFMVIPIEQTFTAYLDTLADSFAGTSPDATEENIQARIRGNTLFALSNKFGWLVLASSNKSETATGYTTLYGDMAGGFLPLKDVPKTMVYRLARYRNEQAGGKLIPADVFTKPPSAELKPDQKDTDSLPPYDLLDPILKSYVEDDWSIDQIVAAGFDCELVSKVVQLVDRSEYKRRQAAPGIKITPRYFGKDRRLPITNGYRG
jgi:NAD+ synthase (glutamine-hydrolysing)